MDSIFSRFKSGSRYFSFRIYKSTYFHKIENKNLKTLFQNVQDNHTIIMIICARHANVLIEWARLEEIIRLHIVNEGGWGRGARSAVYMYPPPHTQPTTPLPVPVQRLKAADG